MWGTVDFSMIANSLMHCCGSLYVLRKQEEFVNTQREKSVYIS